MLRITSWHWGTALFYLISTVIIVLLMSPLAKPIWQIVPIAALNGNTLNINAAGGDDKLQVTLVDESVATDPPSPSKV